MRCGCVDLGFEVKSNCAPSSVGKAPPGCAVITGDALGLRTYQDQVSAGSTFMQLVGAALPAPWMGAAFRSRVFEAVGCTRQSAQPAHFVYVSVAHPAPVMRALHLALVPHIKLANALAAAAASNTIGIRILETAAIRAGSLA